METPVLTPKGWRTIGSLKVGDAVSDPTTGGTTTVIGVFPQGVQDIYRVTFDDGVSTEAGLEHLWAYHIPRYRRARTKASVQRQLAAETLGAETPQTRWNEYRVGTTGELLRILKGGQQPRIPLTEPVLFDVNGRTGTGAVDPYICGLYLGDGHLASLQITCCDDGIRERLIECGFIPSAELHSDGKPKQWRPGSSILRNLYRLWVNNHSLTGCRAWEKFIPPYVFTAPLEYRLDFVRGLMDSDGYVDERGRCYFTSTSEALAQGMRELVWALGGKATIRTKKPTYFYKDEKLDGRPAYEVGIFVRRTSALFFLARKKARCTDKWNGGAENMRAVVSIKKVRRAEAVCIKLSSPFGLYLTDSCIVTHNTDLLLGASIISHKNSIIFRREYQQLKGIRQRALEILGSAAKFNGSDDIWRFPDGRRIEFGAVQHEDDKRKFQGRPHDLKSFDEVTSFSESQFRYLIGWNRSSNPLQRVRVIAAGNPPTDAEGDWVISFWGPWLDPHHPNPAEPGELRWYAAIDGKDVEVPSGESFEHTFEDGHTETIRPLSRTFIRARVQDNAYYMASNYMATLQSLPEPLRSQMLLGDFTAGHKDDPWQVIPSQWVLASQNRWRERRPGHLDCIGVDVARGGDDKTVLSPRSGNWFGRQEVFPGAETPDSVQVLGLINQAIPPGHRPMIKVDVIGVGSAVFDACGMHGLSAAAMNASHKSGGRDKSGQLGFVNKRAEWYWKLREALDPDSDMEIELPPDRGLFADLTAPRWKPTVRGIQIEDKAEIKARIGRSPDKGDSLVYAFGEPTALPTTRLI